MPAPVTPPPPADRIGHGILWMLMATALFVSLDTLAKYLQDHITVAQVVWARYAFHAVLIAAFLAPRLRTVARTAVPGLQFLRSLALVCVTGLFFTGLGFVPLVDASAIMFLTPLLVTALSVPILKERVGPRRWAGVAFGFVGALIVIRPGMGMVQTAALVLLAAAFINASFHLLTRMVGRHDSSLTTLFYTAVLGAVLSSTVVPFFWTPVSDPAVWGLMALLGVFGAASQFALIKAFQAAPPSAIAPFNYSTIVWATVLGLLVFGELPDLPTVVGAAVIIGSGLYVFHRERVVATGDAAAGLGTAAAAAPREAPATGPVAAAADARAQPTAEPSAEPPARSAPEENR